MIKVRNKLYDIQLLLASNPTHRHHLRQLLKEFVAEMYPESTIEPNLEEFILVHNIGIYLLYCDGEPIAFSSYAYNDYCGLKPPAIGNTYMFIKKAFRRSMAFHILSVQSGNIVEAYNIPLEHYYLEHSMSKMSKDKVANGKTIYTAVEYSVKDALEARDKIKGKLTQ